VAQNLAEQTGLDFPLLSQRLPGRADLIWIYAAPARSPSKVLDALQTLSYSRDNPTFTGRRPTSYARATTL